MAGNILDMLSGLFGGGGAAGMATIPGANSNKMLRGLGLGSMGATTPMDDMYGDIGGDIPDPKLRQRPGPGGLLGQQMQPFGPGGLGGLLGQPQQPGGELVGPEMYDNFPAPRMGKPSQPLQPFGGLEGLEGLFPPDTPFGQQGGGIGGTDQRNAIIQLLKLLGR